MEIKRKFWECEHVTEKNKEKIKVMGSMKRENEILKAKCDSYEMQVEDIKGKEENNSEKLHEACSEYKLIELSGRKKGKRKVLIC